VQVSVRVKGQQLSASNEVRDAGLSRNRRELSRCGAPCLAVVLQGQRALSGTGQAR
jgi:hypothetical protein